MYQGIHLYALCSLIFLSCTYSYVLRRIIFTFKNSKVLSTNRVILFRINLFVWIKDLFLNSLISLCLSVLCFRFSMQLSIYRFLTASEKSRVGIEGRRFRFHSCPRVLKKGLVGSNGLEPSTSRLSGVCSNQLSYEPAWWR